VTAEQKGIAYTAPTLSARNLIAAAPSRINSRKLCEAVGLDASRLNDPHGRLPMRQLIALYETAARMTNDHAFGLHVGMRTSLRAFGVLGYVVMNSATVGLAFERLVRYLPIWTDGASFSLCREGSTIHLTWQYMDAGGAECRHDCEMTLLTAIKVSQFSGGIQPREVRFQHSPPKNDSELRRLFRAPVHFRMGANEVIFDRSALSIQVTHADPDLCDLLIGNAEVMLATAPSKFDLMDRVRGALRRSLNDGEIGVSRLSRAIGIGERTLQRKLKAHGTSFRGLLAEVRRELAEQHLRDPEMSITEIAYRLGYSHTSEFHRAFRGSNGIAPRQYRLRNNIGGRGTGQLGRPSCVSLSPSASRK
jgi:AraC-like DNA-binding protein